MNTWSVGAPTNGAIGVVDAPVAQANMEMEEALAEADWSEAADTPSDAEESSVQ